MNTIEEVREFFSKDYFATENGMVIDEIGDHYAKCSLKIEKRHLNAMGFLMGGVPFVLADFTFAVASNWQKPGTVSLTSNISFLSVAKGETIYAEARLIKDGRSTCTYNIDITDNLGNKIALVTTNGFHKA